MFSPELAAELKRAAGLRNIFVRDDLDVAHERLHADFAADAATLRRFVAAILAANSE